MNFEDLPGTRKGYIGEAEVDRYLQSKGIVPYAPLPGRAHPFDRLCASSDKRRLFIAECKAKASRTYYPDTGINLSSYNDYKNILDTYGIDIWLFFVDENTKSIYGNILTELSKQRVVNVRDKSITYPLIQPDYGGRKIIYFPLVAMITICNISDAVTEELRNLSRRNYKYSEAS